MLVFTAPPYLGQGTTQERQWCYAQIAEKIMQHLANKGSGLEPLEFVEGGDGCTWPRYAYRRGTVLYRIQGKVEVVKTTAVPVVRQSTSSWRVERTS